jgi:hypothetical protein
METLPKLINQYPELLSITKPSLKNGIFYNVDFNIVEPLISIYKFYFECTINLFIPKNYKIHKINENVNIFEGDIESLENFKSRENEICIFLYTDIIFNSLYNNKRRLNTLLKKFKSKVILLSITDLKPLYLNLDSFERIDLKKEYSFKEFNLIDLIDQDDFILESNIDSFVELIKNFENKSIYLSLSLPINKIVLLESKLKENDIKTFRKEPIEEQDSTFVVLNASKTTQRNLLKRQYQIYIFILPEFENPLDLFYYFKDTLHNSFEEIYIDSANLFQVEQILDFKENKTIVAKDSKEFETLSSIKIDNLIFASDNYYQFEASEKIKEMDLSNLSKKEYDIIRNFIKLKLNNKFDLDLKTCQLSTPSSPKDRSRKLNSLSNKISSVDYRCDLTCEIFKDFTIGVVIWNEMWNSKEKLNCLKNENYVYQTTKGSWKYTTLT